MKSADSPFLPHGGYRKLRSYKVAEAVYDATVVFCRRFFAHDRRMSDQMVQAARSGVRNIIIDEAHSSQDGKTAAAMSEALALCLRHFKSEPPHVGSCTSALS